MNFESRLRRLEQLMPASHSDLTILVWGADPELGKVRGRKTISDGFGVKEEAWYSRENHEREAEFRARVETALAERNEVNTVGAPSK